MTLRIKRLNGLGMHAVDLEEERKRVLLLAWQGLYSCLYSFDLDGGQWIKCLTIPPALLLLSLAGVSLWGVSFMDILTKL